MTPLTILHTIETAGPGGAENVVLNLASSLNPARFRSLALLPEGRWLPGKLREQGVTTITAESHGWHDLSLIRTMARLVQTEKVNIIHSHLPDQNFYSCLAGRYAGCKTIVTYHGAPVESKGSINRQAIKSWVVRHTADAVVVVSDYLKNLFVDRGFPPGKITRIYNGVNLKRFACSRKGLLRNELHVSPDAQLVGMVANLRQSKGYEFFIGAASQVAATFPQARFVAVGEIENKMVARLNALIEELGLQGRFSFLGYREDIPDVLSDLDVFVLSSTVEGLSIATIEAMAAGRPVVVTRSGGPQEIVEDDRTGFLVPPADAQSIATKVCELLANPERAGTIGQCARREVEGKFSLPGMVDEYQRLYESCLSGS